MLACPRSPASGQATSSTSEPALLQVDTVSVGGLVGGCSFNDGRPWVVSVHKAYDDGRVASELAAAVGAADLGGQVVLDWFGSDAPERVEIVLGQDLPVALAAAVVRVARDHAQGELVVSSSQDQATHCNRARAYVGSLLPTDNPATSDQVLDELAAGKLDSEAFWSRLPPSGR